MKILEFKDGDRTFTCRADTSPATRDTVWWWMSVSGESQRYAAFRAEPGDTESTIRPRILAYYAQLLADRARPRELRSHWSQRKPAAKPGETPGDAVGDAAGGPPGGA